MIQELAMLVEELSRELAPDPRTVILELQLLDDVGDLALTGVTTDPEALLALCHRLAEAAPDLSIRDEVIRLPDPGLGKETFGLVRSAIAPLHSRPQITSTQVSQYVIGHRLDLLSTEGHWWRVRGEDGYIGWMHRGYLETGGLEWARRWERGEGGEPAVSIESELVDDEERTLIQLPWGARVVKEQPGSYRLPDGTSGSLGSGEIVDADRMRDRFPTRAESIVRSARRWIGTPYLWGGVTPMGADCSGFVQSVLWMHGLALPRDSDQQARVGTEIMVAGGADLDLATLRPADLVFFADNDSGRVNHVAISLGGSTIIHSALSNGGVAINDLAGRAELEVVLRAGLIRGCRVLPDP